MSLVLCMLCSMKNIMDEIKLSTTILKQLAPVHLFTCWPVHLFIAIILLYVNHACKVSPDHGCTRHGAAQRPCCVGVKVCNEYWAGFQSSWCWGPTESQSRAGTRTTIASCCPSWTTRSPATSSTASTRRMHKVTSGSSYHGPPTSLRYASVHDLQHVLTWANAWMVARWQSQVCLPKRMELILAVKTTHACRLNQSSSNGFLIDQSGWPCQARRLSHQTLHSGPVYKLVSSVSPDHSSSRASRSDVCRSNRRCCTLPRVPQWRKNLAAAT